MQNNDNNNIQEQEESTHINAEPIIAVFLHENQFYVSTPEIPTEEYYNALSALLFHMKQDTPTIFNELKQLINTTEH